MDDLIKVAKNVRERAYAPYSNFKVGAALQGADGQVFSGCNVENVAYPEGTCAEAGAIAAMVAAGVQNFTHAVVIADSPQPITPCGGCRQKLREFGNDDSIIIMTTMDGKRADMRLADLLPGAFDESFMVRT